MGCPEDSDKDFLRVLIGFPVDSEHKFYGFLYDLLGFQIGFPSESDLISR